MNYKNEKQQDDLVESKQTVSRKRYSEATAIESIVLELYDELSSRIGRGDDFSEQELEALDDLFGVLAELYIRDKNEV